MNKQELINKLKELLTKSTNEYDCGHDYGIIRAIVFAEKLDEPERPPEPKPLELEKPVIPKYVADWIEWCKKHKVTLLGAVRAVCNNKNIRPLDASGWAIKNQETFTKAWFHGYEVEKEKRYTAKLKLTNEYLCYESQFKDLLHYKVPDSSAKEVKSYHFTEYDLVKYHVWGNNDYEVSEII